MTREVGQLSLEFLVALWSTLVDLSPSLLLGLLLAGLLHAYLPRGLVERRLRAGSFRSVLEAVLLGVPLPLCSCGVVPAALGLRREGASLGATTGFLISTPQTGVDSVLVSAAFLGWPFALFKVAAALVTGLVGGVLVNLGVQERAPARATAALAPLPPVQGARLVRAGSYALFELFAAIDLWIIAGVVISAALSVWVPAGSLAGEAWVQGLWGMILVLALSLPLYICSTGSVPIAAALIAAGMPAGSALVFLMAGPATNAATLGAVGRTLGARVLAIYLGVVALSSLALGVLFDFVIGPTGEGQATSHAHHLEDGAAGGWLGPASAGLVLALLGLLSVRRALRWRRSRRERLAAARGEGGSGMDRTIRVEGMTCHNCVAHVRRALESIPGIRAASPELRTGRVLLEGEPVPVETLREVLRAAGYPLVED